MAREQARRLSMRPCQKSSSGQMRRAKLSAQPGAGSETGRRRVKEGGVREESWKGRGWENFDAWAQKRSFQTEKASQMC